MLFEEPPAGFDPCFDVVSYFLESGGRILLLHRRDHKPQGGTWGVPAGKVDEGEGLEESLLREIREETGISLVPSALSFFRTVHVRYPSCDFTYRIYHARLLEMPRVELSQKEHSEFRWVRPLEALKLPLIRDLGGCIELFYGPMSG